MPESENPYRDKILRVRDLPAGRLPRILDRYHIQLVKQPPDQVITGSYWGDEEAGLVQNRLYVRADTPVHSALHEACHYICMDKQRRENLHTDAGGDYDEENAVCYLQILLASTIPEMGMRRMCRDMDAWGYTFRLGSAKRWFTEDAADALGWLERRGIVVRVNARIYLLAGTGLSVNSALTTDSS